MTLERFRKEYREYEPYLTDIVREGEAVPAGTQRRSYCYRQTKALRKRNLLADIYLKIPLGDEQIDWLLETRD
jgi:hypothetical protein